jgi:hypothetical protein
MGLIFAAIGATGLVDLAGRAFPKPLIRGVQLTVGLLFLKIAWGLVSDPPASFSAFALAPVWAVPLGLAVVAVAVLLRRRPVTLVLVAIGVAAMLVRAGDELVPGPSALAVPSLDGAAFWTAFTVLVIPQLPLTFANSCLATADAAQTYFGKAAERVRAGRLALTLGSANVFAGAISGMPVCHGAGGLTAHVAFGARTWRAPAAMGAVLVVVALAAGAGLAGVLPAFPLPILAGLLGVAGLLHIGLLRDLRGARAWAIALLVGGLGFEVNLLVGLLVGLAAWWIPMAFSELAQRRRRRRAVHGSGGAAGPARVASGHGD